MRDGFAALGLVLERFAGERRMRLQQAQFTRMECRALESMPTE
jgi:hypothetical protein